MGHKKYRLTYQHQIPNLSDQGIWYIYGTFTCLREVKQRSKELSELYPNFNFKLTEVFDDLS